MNRQFKVDFVVNFLEQMIVTIKEKLIKYVVGQMISIMMKYRKRFFVRLNYTYTFSENHQKD
jgi:F0F1-type ATP synthase delta subunit